MEGALEEKKIKHNKFTAKHTLYGCYLGYITQAIVNNLPPLLFVTFNRQFGISLEKIGLLITVNFCIQILVDLISPGIIKKVGFRKSLIFCFIITILGLTGFSYLPFIFPNAYPGLLLCMFLNAVGGGILEVIVSPLVESVPGDEKESAMSLLHSFYCWGHVAVILLSTLYFTTIGVSHWRFLPGIWAVIPLISIFLFLKVPIYAVAGDEEGRPAGSVFKKKIFWILFVLMICAGASEQAIGQWSSLFAETGLKVSKTVGDLLGPCSFAVCMGISRTLYGIWGSRIAIGKALIISCLLCITGYLITVFVPIPLLSLMGCGICGFAVGLMWPGVFSLAGKLCYGGGTFMYAILALGGDAGCSAGPTLVGIVSGMTGEMKLGILAAIGFPVLMFLVMGYLNTNREKEGLAGSHGISAGQCEEL